MLTNYREALNFRKICSAILNEIEGNFLKKKNSMGPLKTKFWGKPPKTGLNIIGFF